ncbi:hypothetical protein JB92DRAFT_3250498 [Gautieria morchelliformis]|nr:hypothetical protein JB92DRAFT_3250498 [Gautieria morchelliformis]
MKYRQTCTNEILVQLEGGDMLLQSFDDFLHGKDYLDACRRGDIGPYDTVVMFSIDGAQLYCSKALDCWIYIWVILNLNPNIRYTKIYVIPGGSVPGPNNLQHPESFLFPGFHHISAVQKEAINIGDAISWAGTADGPGSVHFTGLAGHHGAFPCRIFCGLKGRHKPGGSHYYPALLKPFHYDMEDCDHEDVNISNITGLHEEDYQQKLKYLMHSPGPTNYKTRRRLSGISRPSLISGLSPWRRLTITSTVAGDSMHVPTLNLGPLLIQLWWGKFQ